mgnify:FL=1
MEPILILWAVLITAAIAIVLALCLALANRYLKVEEDPRKEKLLELLPNANCGACGFPGCSGLADAIVEGKEKKVTRCAVIKKDKAQEIKDYLESTPDANGNTLKVEL